MLDQVTSDVVLALRGIRAAPAIPFAAVLTTSLAVAINLAMAGLIDRALLRPPAHVAHPEQIFTVGYEVRSPSGDKIVAGRGFTVEDDRGAPVVVVSETMARAIWP